MLSNLLFDDRSIGCASARVNGTIAEKDTRIRPDSPWTFIYGRGASSSRVQGVNR